jgi:uncharacterized protein YecE (DUF72 family)
MTVYIGTSGWQYNHWRDRFYPRGCPQKRWLEHYAERFRTVESNNAFYRLPKPETFASWAQRTPADFVWTVKVSRYLTHIRRLREPAEPVQRFLSHASKLGDKLGPVLLQLPPNLKADHAALDDTLARFGKRARVSVEFRHDTWFDDETRAVLDKHGAALCLADRDSRPVSPLWRTAGWAYLRLHEGSATPHPCYGRAALRSWAQRLRDGWGGRAEAYVFFNNDPLGCALRDARTFARECERVGLRPTRVPDESLPVG